MISRLGHNLRSLRSVLRVIMTDPSNRGQRGYRLAMSIGWQFYKRTVGLPLVVTLGNGARYIADPRATNATGVVYTRVYEAQYVEFLRRHIVKTDHGAMIDVGAHTGLFTLWLADRFVSGLCIEPAVDTFALLQSNLRINNYDRVAVRCGASDVEGVVRFVISGAFGSQSAIVNGDREIALGQRVEEIPSRTVDNLWREKMSGCEMTLLKIDTEGHEMKVLQGAREVLEGSPQAMILVENSAPVELDRFLSDLGFDVFAIDENGRVLRDEKSKQVAYNLLACGPGHPLHRSENPSK